MADLLTTTPLTSVDTNAAVDVVLLPSVRGTQGFHVVTVYAWGTFDSGAEIKLQTSPDNSEWFDHPDAQFTAKGTIDLTLGGGIYLRSRTGSGGTTFSLNMAVSD